MEFFTHQTLSNITSYGLPAVLGGFGGFLVYKFVGCKTGVCPITNNRWLSILYGAIIGVTMGPM
jgi:hypothetical protein